MKRWDVFLSHASEDRDAAAALAKELRKAGLQVWIDHQELRLGDSLRAEINQGLSQSRFGVVLISPNFISKHWPIQELKGLFAREDGGEKVTLPVLHNLAKEALGLSCEEIRYMAGSGMSQRPTAVTLTQEDRSTLERWVRAGTTERRLAERARIILLAAAGQGTIAIARLLRMRAARASKWRVRFGRDGLRGLQDAPRPRGGAPL